MPHSRLPRPEDDAVARRLDELEARIASLEHQVRRDDATPAAETETDRAADDSGARAVRTKTEEELEFEVGQNWFARVGILVLAIGGAFMLSLPYPQFAPSAPAIVGYAIALALFLCAQWWQRGFELVANYFRGAAMALLWFATLRLFFFGEPHAVAPTSVLAPGLLTVVLGVNLSIALRRRSPRLMALALATGYASAAALDVTWLVLATVAGLGAVAAATSRKLQWSLPLATAIVVGPLTYALWSLGEPIRHQAIHVVTTPSVAPVILLAVVVVVAIGSWHRASVAADPVVTGVSAALNCACGYGAFLLHTGAAFSSHFVTFHVVASVVFLAIAALFWITRHCHASTFFYAMTAYAALSVAIMNASAVPNVFVWLSAESIVVVATAVWFRSRFIVVANFLIYVLTVLGYVVLKGQETGISIGIGIVALLSARILNWQQNRLELKTELMRNAYLFSAFLVFPYSLYHLVPPAAVGLAWVGLAVVYYVLNLIVRSPKYRWMGHATLLFTTVYLVVIGTRKLEPAYRVISFLALGSVLLAVSMTFSRLRLRARRAGGAPQ
jgi:uncharacterized membrane protein